MTLADERDEPLRIYAGEEFAKVLTGRYGQSQFETQGIPHLFFIPSHQFVTMILIRVRRICP